MTIVLDSAILLFELASTSKSYQAPDMSAARKIAVSVSSAQCATPDPTQNEHKKEER